MRRSSVILSAVLALTAFVTALILDHRPVAWSGVWQQGIGEVGPGTGRRSRHDRQFASRRVRPRTEAEFLAESGRRFLEAGNEQGALELFRAALAADPSRVELLAAIGFVYSRLGRDPMAEHYLQQYLDSSKTDDEMARAHLGVTQLRLHKYAAAAANLSRALRSDPSNGPLNCAAAAAYARMVDADRAFYYLDIAQKRLGTGILPYLTDSNFDTIRDRPEFKRIIETVLRQVDRTHNRKEVLGTVSGKGIPPPEK